ncbi:MAG: hypothetical protein M1831_005959 [Alyxoria varia]|nr:MAG: hypothetical protein M1831_005959 [Alyxoria varia]
MIITLSFLIPTIAPLGLTWANPLKTSSYAVKETHIVPHGWKHVGAAPLNHQLDLKIGVKQNGFRELEKRLYQVSDPSHDDYGQHLSSAQVNELVKPSPAVLDDLHRWLEGHGIPIDGLKHSTARDWIHVTVPVAKAQALLAANYSMYEHEDGTHLVRAPQWSLPLHLHEHIDTIQPTNSFLRAIPEGVTSRVRPDSLSVYLDELLASLAEYGEGAAASQDLSKVCDPKAITPLCLRKLYGTFDYVPQAIDRNKVGMTNYLGEEVNRTDFRMFLDQFRPDAANASDTFVEYAINAGNISSDTGSGVANREASLDSQTILGIAHPIPLVVYSIDGRAPFTPQTPYEENSNEPYLDWVHTVLNQADKDIPQTISTSYGEPEQTVPESYARRVCNEFAQLGARGVTLLFSSGDNGVGGDGKCYMKSDTERSRRVRFQPVFPASCPFVTSVGATKNINPEIVAYDDPASNDPLHFGSQPYAPGGGFSDIFPRPSYQDAAIPPYINALDGNLTDMYNHSGRGFPDVSAQGQAFVTAWMGKYIFMDGTSASSPTVAAVISLVNDALIAAGSPPLGFMNPWLYKTGTEGGWTDVLQGSATGCRRNSGFPAREGWDAVTGWGTPWFPKLKDLALEAARGKGLGWAEKRGRRK